MQCRYINLDHAVERRAAIEASFDRAARPGWGLTRFQAIDTGYVDAQSIDGIRSTREKACFLSHKALIEAHDSRAGHLLVLEDDVEFGLATCEVVDGFLQNNAGGEWDLLFLDVCVIGVEDMLKLYFNRHALMNERRIVPLDLAQLPFFGTNAYIVNARSVQKLLACLDAGIPVDVEYDIYLAEQIRQGHLKATVLFPFITTLSEHATKSQIQPSAMEKVNHIRSLFRNLVWLESRPDRMAACVAEFEAALATTRHRTFFTLLSALILTFNEISNSAGPA